jgi:hypothetical protein
MSAILDYLMRLKQSNNFQLMMKLVGVMKYLCSGSRTILGTIKSLSGFDIGGDLCPFFDDNVTDAKRSVGEKCGRDADCLQGCGYKNADAKDMTCCPAGAESPYGNSYCKNLADGEGCYYDVLCKSNNCVGNMYGATRGVCTKK